MNTLTPDDVPLHRYGGLEEDMLRRANAHGDAARKHVVERDADAAVSRLEAALALYQEALLLTRINRDAARKIADKHARTLADATAEKAAQQEAAGWPIPELTNFSHPNYAPSDEMLRHKQQHPDWGVEAPASNDVDTTVTLTPQANSGCVLMRAVEVDTHGNEQTVYAAFSAAQWRALDRLAGRILHDMAIPYDEDGHVVIPADDHRA